MVVNSNNNLNLATVARIFHKKNTIAVQVSCFKSEIVLDLWGLGVGEGDIALSGIPGKLNMYQ